MKCIKIFIHSKLAMRIMMMTIPVLLSTSAFCQSGSIDPTFNPLDLGPTVAGANGIVRAMALQSDGKIIIAGDFTFFRGTTRNKIARVNSDGTLDATFDPAGGANDIIKTVALQADGKIVIGGIFTNFNGTTRNRLARLNADGTLDTSFDPGAGANGTIDKGVIQPDGKIVIVGNFTSYGGTSRNYISRVNVTGTIDLTFNPGAGANSTINTVSLQTDGKLVIGGSFTSYSGTPRPYLARVNPDGTLDPLFSPFTPGIGPNNAVYATALQSDGKIIIGGDFTTYSGINTGKIARLLTDGSLDTSFNSSTGANGAVNSVFIQSDGKIVMGGSFTMYNGLSRAAVARINTNGTNDTFNSGTTTQGTAHAVLSLPSGKILLAGDFATIGYKFMRLNTDGTHDAFFVGIGGVGQLTVVQPQPGIVRKVILAPDGKIVIGGIFISYNGVSRNNAARLNSDGTLDETFNMGVGYSPVVPLAVQSDGKIILGNIRLNTDGTTDATYNAGGVGANSLIYSVHVQPDGKMLIGGDFYQYNNVNRGGVARLNANGTLDGTFSTTTGATYWQAGYTQDIPGIVNSIIPLSSGKILIGGLFTKYNGTAKTCIARLNSNGTLDNTFAVTLDPTTNIINVIREQSDGKILIGGTFTVINGVNRKNIARLNSDGTLDTSFNPGTGFNYAPQNIWLQPDGKIVVTGDFTTFNGLSSNGFIRLSANGTKDASFNTGTGVNNSVISSIMLPDAKVIVAGNFTSYDGTSKNGIARILNKFDQTITFNNLSSTCLGSTILLTGTSTSGLPIIYTSSNPSIASISGNSVITHTSGTVTITASQPGNSTYNAAVSVPRSLTITNFSAGTITGAQTLCNGGNPAAFTQTAASGAGTITYQWQKSIDGISYSAITGAISATYDPPAGITQTTHYQRLAVSTSCTGSVPSNILTVTVDTVNPLISAPVIEFCQGQSIDAYLTANSMTNSNYSWKRSGVTVASGLMLTTYHALQTGSYTVTITTANSCTGTSAPLTVSQSNGVGNIRQLGDLCTDGYVDLNAAWPSSGSNFIWSTNETTQTIRVYNAGTYSVNYTSASGCNLSASTLVELIPNPGPCIYARQASTKPEKNEIENKSSGITLYPNPADATLTIHLPEPVKQNVTVSLYSQYGQEVKSAVLVKGEYKIEFDTKLLSEGMYVLTLRTTSGNINMNRKVIINH